MIASLSVGGPAGGRSRGEGESRLFSTHRYEGIHYMTTTTQENARPLPLIGQSVGQAQATLTRLLDGILAESGTSHQVWLGLQRLNALGDQPGRDAYERDLSNWLQLDGQEAARLDRKSVV